MKTHVSGRKLLRALTGGALVALGALAVLITLNVMKDRDGADGVAVSTDRLESKRVIAPGNAKPDGLVSGEHAEDMLGSLHGTTPQEEDANDLFYLQFSPSYVKKAKQKTDVLTKESVAESLHKLDDVDWYYEWVVERRPGRLEPPLEDGHGDVDLQRILGNRRFRKLLEELREKPGAETARLLGAEIDTALRLYSDLFWKEWARFEEIRSTTPLESRVQVGPSCVVSSNPDGTPTLEGVRLKVLALTLLATNLEAKEVAPNVEAVIGEALRQRTHFYEKVQGNVRPDGISMLGHLGIYNRGILGGAILTFRTGLAPRPRFALRRGSLIDKKDRDRLEATADQANWMEDERGNYKACVFANNVDHLKEDLSHGTVLIRHLDPFLSENNFNALLAEIGSAANHPEQ